MIADWNKTRRYYTCVSADATGCNKYDNASMSMYIYGASSTAKLYDGSSGSGTTNLTVKNISPAYIPRKTASAAYDCIPNAKLFINECKSKAQSNNASFLRVEGLDKAFSGNDASTNIQIKCYLADATSAQATENCSACGVPVLDASGNWKCKYGDKSSTTDTGSGFTSAATAKKQFKDTASYFKENGILDAEKLQRQGCFKNCTGDMIKNNIRNGTINGESWGLVWKNDAKLWECFTCDNSTQVNSMCERTLNTTKGYTYDNCNAKDGYGVCQLKHCNGDFQKMMSDGKCYTKWCMLTSQQRAGLNECYANGSWVPSFSAATCGGGGPTDWVNTESDGRCCGFDLRIGKNIGALPQGDNLAHDNKSCNPPNPLHPIMLYNEAKDCVYCWRGPPVITN